MQDFCTNNWKLHTKIGTSGIIFLTVWTSGLSGHLGEKRADQQWADANPVLTQLFMNLSY